MALHGAPQLELDSKHLTPDIQAGFHAVIAKHPAGLTTAGMATRLTACAVMAHTCCLELRAAHNMIDCGFAEEPLVSKPYYTCVKQDDMLDKMMETMVEALEVCHMSHMQFCKSADANVGDAHYGIHCWSIMQNSNINTPSVHEHRPSE